MGLKNQIKKAKNLMSKTESNSLLLFAGAFSLGAIFSYFASEAGSKKWRQLSDKWKLHYHHLEQ